MPEISYPFAADSAGGGRKVLSQVEWQNMAHLWGPDRIDFQLTNATYTSNSLPFFAAISGANLTVQPGSAWVGGFYYKLDSTWTQAAPTNSGSQPRIDLVVLRANLTTGSVNLAIKTGQAAANPVEPGVTRTLGGVWEMPLWAISLGANNGARTISDRRRFAGPGTVHVPWNRSDVSESMPRGVFTLDMDSNSSGGQEEGYRGLSGDFVTRSLGKRREYNPSLLGATTQPGTNYRNGYWRYIAPGTVSFTLTVEYTGTGTIRASSGVSALGVTLPVACSRKTPSILTGQLSNPDNRSGMPNSVLIVGRTSPGTQNCYLAHQSISSLSAGLDGWVTFPGKSAFTLTGVYETNDLD